MRTTGKRLWVASGYSLFRFLCILSLTLAFRHLLARLCLEPLMRENTVVLQLFTFLRRISDPSSSRTLFCLLLDGPMSKSDIGNFFPTNSIIVAEGKRLRENIQNIA